MIDAFRQSALRISDGDFQKADYFLNCSIAEYYTRLKDWKVYTDWKNESLKNNTND